MQSATTDNPLNPDLTINIPTPPSSVAVQIAALASPPPNPPPNSANGGASASDATIAAALAPESLPVKAVSSSIKSRFVLKHHASEDGRVVKVTVTDLSAEFELVKTRVYHVLGQSEQNAVLARQSASGEVRVDIVGIDMLPPKTLKAFKSATTKRGAYGQQRASEVQTLKEDDFMRCSLEEPGGSTRAGYVCVKEGPLFGKTCDAAMMVSLVTRVSYWTRSHSNMFQLKSELLDISVPPNYLPLAQVNWLSPQRGRSAFRACVGCDSRLGECLFGESSRRAVGNRTVVFASAQKLIAGMMAAGPPLSEEYSEALGLMRRVVGAAETTVIGSFIVCTKQQTAPWGTAVQCLCHLQLEGGVNSVLRRKLDTRTRCQESMKSRGKSGEGKRSRSSRSSSSSSSSSKTNKAAKGQAKVVVL